MTELEILYEDRDLVAVNKPPKVNSHPNPGRETHRSAFLGRYDMKDRRFDDGGRSVWLLHRLDRDTSGILLAAKSPDAASAMKALFKSREIVKSYTALVSGLLRSGHGDWRDYIETQSKGMRVLSRVWKDGPPNAELGYQVAQRFPECGLSLLDIDLRTGKTHQIRVQCAHHRHPVLGDRTYGDFQLNKLLRRRIGLARLFLHASAVEFSHPRSGRRQKIVSPLPEALAKVLEKAQ